MPVINNGFHCNIAGNIPQCFVPSFSSCYMMKNTVQDHMQISSVHSHSAAFIHSSKSSWMIKHTHSIRSHAIYRRIYNSFLVVARIFVPSSLRRSLIFSSILVISFYFLFFSYLLQFKSFLFLWKSFVLFIHQKT